MRFLLVLLPLCGWLSGAQALASLAQQGESDDHLIEQLGSDDDSLRDTAIESLAKKGRDVTGQLEAELDSRSASRRKKTAVVETLGKMGRDGIRTLEHQLFRAPDAVALPAMLSTLDAISNLGASAAWTASSLIELIERTPIDGDDVDAHVTLRCAGIMALGKLGPSTTKARSALRRQLREKNALVRMSSARALWWSGSEPKRVYPVLLEGLELEEVVALERAITGLGEMGPQAESAVPRLEELRRTVAPLTVVAIDEAVRKIRGGDSEQARSACKLPVSAGHVGLGVPKSEGFMPSTGIVRAVVLFADFPDAVATQTPGEVLALVSPGAETFFADISYGRLAFELEPHPVWLRLSRPSAHYGAGLLEFHGHREFVQESVDLADPDVDFTDASLVVVLANPRADELPLGPAFGSVDRTGGIRADGMFIANGVTSGFDLTGWGFLWLNHEVGHSMTLPDLYAYETDGTFEYGHRFTGYFGLMGNISGKAPEYFAFERWMLGWVDDDQIVCQQTEEETTTLTAIETAGGIKAVIVPTGPTTAVMVESRRALGYDTRLEKSGALVYSIDTSIPSGAGPIKVLPVIEQDPGREQSPLAVGESVVVGNVTVAVVDATPDGDTVRVTVAEVEQVTRADVEDEGTADLSAAQTRLALAPVLDAIAAGKTSKARALIRKLPPSIQPIAERMLDAKKSRSRLEAPGRVRKSVKEIALSDTAPAVAEVGWLQPAFDRVPDDSVLLAAGGRVFAHGLYAHAPSRFAYVVGGKWSTLSGEAGLHDDHHGTVVFAIEVDGEERWRSQNLTTGRIAGFEIDVSDADRIDLLVEDAGDGNGSDWGLWLEPVLKR